MLSFEAIVLRNSRCAAISLLARVGLFKCCGMEMFIQLYGNKSSMLLYYINLLCDEDLRTTENETHAYYILHILQVLSVNERIRCSIFGTESWPSDV